MRSVFVVRGTPDALRVLHSHPRRRRKRNGAAELRCLQIRKRIASGRAHPDVLTR